MSRTVNHRWSLALVVTLFATIAALALPSLAFAAPSNDNFANATDASQFPFSDVQDNTTATTEAGEPQMPSCAGMAGIANTVWYRVTPASSITLSADLSGSSNVNFAMAVYTGGALSSLGEIACTTGSTPVSFSATGGTTYFVQIGGEVAMGSPATGSIHFQLAQLRQLSVTTTGGFGSGSVSSGDGGISCPSTCSHAYGQGSMVTLTASPDANNTFAGWSGGGCSGTGTCQVTMSADTAVTASFDAPPITVNSSGDDALASADNSCETVAGNGICTLRAAIELANAGTGAHHIEFSIGTGTATITPASALPTITNKLWVDGSTQPGFAGAPVIELSGASASGDGLQFCIRHNTGVVPCVSADVGSRVTGLVINGWSGAGVYSSTDSLRLTSNYIGTDLSGALARPNGQGVLLDGGQTYIGTGLASASYDEIGGPSPADRNVISGNTGNGVTVMYDCSCEGGAVNNTITNNLIGLAVDGSSALGNGGKGVELAGKGHSIVSSNGIAFNGGAGVGVVSGDATGPNSNTQNLITQNSIYANGGIGIDLGDDGLTPNDAGDGDTGANDLQNFPVLNSAISSGGSTAVQGTLNSSPSTSYRIEFFANPSCDTSGNGQGKTYLGSVTTSTDGGGNTGFTVSGLPSTTVGHVVTATAIITSAGASQGDTSEFSACRTIASTIQRTLTVTKTGTGGGSLSSNPTGIDCGATCTHDYDDGTPVTLIATPNSGSVFASWSGACSGTGTCQVTMDAAKSVTASFTKTFSLSVSKTGTGGGSVTSDVGGIFCGSSCSATYDDATIVTLTATPGSGSTFAAWSGACTGTGACHVTMSADKIVSAIFKLVPPGTKITRSAVNAKNHEATFSFKAIGKATGFKCALVKAATPPNKTPPPSYRSCGSPKTYSALRAGSYTFFVRAFNGGGPDPTPAKSSFTI